MNTKNLLCTLCVATAMIVSTSLASSCRNESDKNAGDNTESAAAQRQVNDFVTTLDQYAASVREATSIEEIQELDNQFATQISKYADSKETINDADREAILAASEKYSIAINSQVEKLTGEAVMTFDQLQTQKEALREALAECRTLGQVVSL